MNYIKGKHYLSCVYANTGFVMIYNKNTIEENGFEDTAELAYNNEWTWSKFKEMCYDFADREQDKYAVGGWWYEPATILSTGKSVIGMENGKIVNNLMSSELERVENLFREMKIADVMFPYSEYDWNDFPERIGEGKTLFYPLGRWKLLEPDLSAFGDYDDIMFVPMPRDENADAWYLSATGGVDAYALCKGAANPEAVAAYVNCKLVEKNDESVQEVNEAENAIRPFVVGRKNWLFSNTQNGARASALIYSLAVTACANGLNVEDYFFRLLASDEPVMPWNG